MKAIKPGISLLWYGAAALWLWFIINFGMPFIRGTFQIGYLLGWIVSAFFIYVPIFAGSLIAIKKEGIQISLKNISQRFRLKKLTKQDWEMTFIGLMVILVSMAIIIYFTSLVTGKTITSPYYLRARALYPWETYVYGVWAFLFFFNVIGEEFLWRGYFLPRHELTYGKYAWFFNGILWMLFHIPFGYQYALTLIPLFFILPFLVQKQKNIWIGIIIYAAINGPAFVMVALGYAIPKQ
ncbi:MAG: CPBP family intramembrane glutamic endopeptidase [Ignavibacteriaceae bacterium]|jgi:membrane protease YdiL (CAAX protease family)|nr:CPBP family intramembrane glutamic endopeptidase [Ignavibacteriaceae bacterium]